jgi:trans-aconitate methyltransferase
MDARLQLRVQRYGWDAAASHYHSGWETQLRPAHDQLLSVAEIAPGQRIIETACGSGLVTLRLAAMVGPQGRILATDLSQGMLDDLRARPPIRETQPCPRHRRTLAPKASGGRAPNARVSTRSSCSTMTSPRANSS